MSGKGECSAWGGKTAWGRREEDCEPIVSFVEIMSEELADSLNEEERKKEQEFLNAIAQSETAPVYSNDEEMARALQREFDREYDLSVRLNQEKQKGKGAATVTVTPDRYCPKTTQDSDQSSDDEDVRQFATDLLYAKLSDDVPAHSGSVYRNAGGELVTKHDANVSARRNADKTMNDKVNLAFGDMRNEQINSRVYNSLRNFSKTETKRQHKLKDKESAVLNAVSDETGEKFAIKVYKTSLTEFKNRSEYVKDDFRFKNPRGVLKIWAEREFMNLTRMARVGLPCPQPVKLKRHLLVMSLIGENGVAAPRLKNIDWDFSTIEERKDIYMQVQDIMCRMYKECKLVHGDLSEFNLLLSAGKVYVIDVSQAMDLSHPRNLHYLIRDIENVLAFFQKLDIPDLPTNVALFNMITDLSMSEEGSLLVQVEQFSEDNREHQINKSKPADFEWAAYNKERKELRGESPARDYN
ncbi:RIO1 family protein [Ancylostoma ceylanicum]|uniref:Serine/threonine-protein kinase RIO3 n=1 Tax=Ancylostoma ceylanicum TaxID=53326 RepID=A0A0D6M6R7_9BILA|nr:RIO1 family protein [Ancylostoma ceylanicum]